MVGVNLNLPAAGRVLDFDIENRPLSYLGMDFTTAEVTAIAAGWVGADKVHVFSLKAEDMLTDKSALDATRKMLASFSEMWEAADIVTGHYIRRHDIPIINGALAEAGLPRLGPKRTSDTKMDLIGFKGVSKSQESLGLMLAHFDSRAKYLRSKEHMGQDDWRRANRLTREGVKETKRRVVGDVKQHKELRQALIKARLLGPTEMYQP